MVEVAIAKEIAQTKKGLIKEHSSEGVGDQNFKEVFARVATKSSLKNVDEEKLKAKNSTKTKTKHPNLNDKTLNMLLNSLLLATKEESNKSLKQIDLQTKLVKAKNILESKLNQSIDIKDLKDAKTLTQLIIQANRKGLNVKDVKFEVENPKEKRLVQNFALKEIKNTTTQQAKIAHSSALSSILHKQGKTKEITTQDVKISLASLLSKGQTKEVSSLHSDSIASIEGRKSVQKDAKGSILHMLLNKENTDEKKSFNAVAARTKGNLNQKDSIDKQSTEEKVIQTKLIEQQAVKLKAKQQEQQSKDSWISKIGSTFEAQSLIEVKPTASLQQTQSNLSDKIFDAKTTIKHFASALKEQIQEYKPPISRLTLTLNPKNLGELDIVIRSRGDSLTVQISSTTAQALQILAQNSMELRQNLQNMGFENLSMQFSSGNKEDNHQGFEHKRRFYSENELVDDNLSAMVDQIEIELPKYA